MSYSFSFIFIFIFFFWWKCIFRNYDSGIPKVMFPLQSGLCDLAKELYGELDFWELLCPQDGFSGLSKASSTKPTALMKPRFIESKVIQLQSCLLPSTASGVLLTCSKVQQSFDSFVAPKKQNLAVAPPTPSSSGCINRDLYYAGSIKNQSGFLEVC